MSQFGRKKKSSRLSGPKPIEEESPLKKDALKPTKDELPPAELKSLPAEIQAAAKRAKWSKLMDVQARSLPYILKKQDLMVQSKTGSGKTGAFILPLIKRLDPNKAECQALILVPTRELAQQVHLEAKMLFGDSGLQSMPIYGGVGYGAQLKGLEKGVQLVVGTPGRILDHMQRGTLKLDKLRILVLDEADRMLSMGFYPDMERIKGELPGGKHINTYLFSATFPPRVMGLADSFLNKPETLSLSKDNVHVTEINHRYAVVRGLDKDRVLLRLIEVENPDQALIFCNTKAQVEYLAETLKNFGHKAEGITSDLSQANRERLIHQMKAGQLRLLVATDVASRGIDIPALSHVFLYEVPEDHEDYIHRAGRTGRAGATGTAITLTGIIEQLTLKRLARRYKIEMPKIDIPTESEVENIVSERLEVMLEARLHGLDPLTKERVVRFTDLARRYGETEDGQKLLAMVLDSFYIDAQSPELAEALDPTPKKPESTQRGGRSDSTRQRRTSSSHRSGGGDRKKQDRSGSKSGNKKDSDQRHRPRRSEGTGAKSGKPKVSEKK
ncbi:DEAD/DEAH box helicase [bacterium]|nr:DEAD/DEAH box helicase [bacterium]